MTGMRHALAIAAAAFIGALLAPAPAAAQESTSVTGCLAKAESGAFTITGEDGTSWELSSSDVQLEGHQGHKVTITGTPAGIETGAVGATDTGMARDTGAVGDTGMAHGDMNHAEHGEADHRAPHDTGTKKSAGTLNVTSMSMVSATCS